MKNNRNVFLVPIIVGALLITLGLLLPVPGAALTTTKLLNGNPTSYSVLSNRYSAIDEYVGGDAYNFIIGAVLVGSKITGMMTLKALFIVGGALCASFGVAFMLYRPLPANAFDAGCSSGEGIPDAPVKADDSLRTASDNT